jgi:alginate O-acetyltransferase complex protein AlgI
MLFTEPVFFAFFAAYFLVHLALPHRYRVYLIIVGGLIFYQHWKLSFIWLPVFLIAIAYLGAGHVDRAVDERKRKRRLILSLGGLVAPLIAFKYSNFLFANFAVLFRTDAQPILEVDLPLGISFITFTLIAYVVDVYRHTYPHEKAPKFISSYVLFFPHLIAGPILRPRDLIPQIKKPRPARPFKVTLGASIFVMGLVKKLVFADQISVVVDRVYLDPQAAHSAYDYLLALYGFAVQIYCDFSGYTDMAIGLAILLGFRLPNNFNKPYHATSIADFWRRWHITLSHWLRDYIYIPLGGNRRGNWSQSLNVMITMVIGGLWHGANWTFVLWGMMHGIGIVVSHAVSRTPLLAWVGHAPRWLKILVTFHFVVVTWVFFRAPDLATANTVITGPFTASWNAGMTALTLNAFSILLMAVFFALHFFDHHAVIRYLTKRFSALYVWTVLVGFGILAIALSAGSSAKFIYFDF